MEQAKLTSLVQAMQAGDRNAARKIYELTYQDVYYFIFKTVQERELAEDLTQDTFIRIMEHIGSLQEPAAFQAWSRQIAYSCCTAYFRKRKELLLDEQEDGTTPFESVVEENAEFIPHEALDREDLKKTILDMLSSLPQEQRSALLLRYYEEQPISQIAQIQGVSEGTVKSRLNYGRKALRKCVEDYEKKNGIKLHSFAVLPVLLWLLRKQKLLKGVAITAGAVGASGSAAGTAGGFQAMAAAGKAVASKPGAAVAGQAMAGVAGKSGAAVAGNAAAGAAAKGFFGTLAGKITAGVVALAVVAGGVTGVVVLGQDKDEKAEKETAAQEQAQETKPGADQEDPDYREPLDLTPVEIRLPTKAVVYDEQNDIENTYTFTYNHENMPERITQEGSDVEAVYFYDDEGSCTGTAVTKATKLTKRYDYYADGTLKVEASYGDGVKNKEVYYDRQGNAVKAETYKDGKLTETTDYTYNESNHLLQFQTVGSDGAVTQDVQYERDSQGRMAKRTYYKDGVLIEQAYTYNEAGDQWTMVESHDGKKYKYEVNYREMMVAENVLDESGLVTGYTNYTHSGKDGSRKLENTVIFTYQTVTVTKSQAKWYENHQWPLPEPTDYEGYWFHLRGDYYDASAEETPKQEPSKQETAAPEQSAQDQQREPGVDVTPYLGDWKATSSLYNTITLTREGDRLKVEMYCINNTGSRIATVEEWYDLSQMQGDGFTFSYEDSWGNRGTVTITLGQDQIYAQIQETQEGSYAMWGMIAGDYVYNRK